MSLLKRSSMFSSTLTTLLLLILAAANGSGQETKDTTPSVKTTGESVVTVQPDTARIDIGVVTQAPTSQAAVEANAKKVEATITRIKTLLSPGEEVRTISYTVSPNYRYPREGGEPTITGYTASNTVRVRIENLAKIGRIIDATAQAGANRIQGLQFGLKNEEAAQAKALAEAAVAARRKAVALASALGVSLGRVLSVVESGQVGIPVREYALARAESDAASTPIEPGTIEVRAVVSLTMEIVR